MLQKEMRTLAGEREYILIDGYGTAEDFAAVSDVLSGKIAICSRGGGIDFVTKADNAVKAGASAVAIYDNQPGSLFLMSLGFYFKSNPAVSLTQEGGNTLRDAAEPVYDVDGNILYYQGMLTVSTYAASVQEEPEYYSMSSFSSWGIPGSLELKPEITAPGGSIFSVNGGTSDTNAYENMSGTSMAAPQVAGMTALVAQYIEETGLLDQTGLSPRVLAQSLLMSTAEPILEESTGTYYPVLRQGSGLANVGAAVAADSYIMMGADATDTWDDGKIKVELGDDRERTGEYQFTFTVNNITDEDRIFTLSADFFTQALFSAQLEEGGEVYAFLDTGVSLLNTVVSWEANGKQLQSVESLDGLDFDGDGDVDADDGQAILDYNTGLRGELSNAERADLDGDGDVDTYDAYLFFTRYNTGALVVSAGGKAEVKVTVALTEDQKAQLNENYENGAYVEGYVFVKSVETEEGILGTSHSIPVIGFYGDWSDPSMLEEGQYEEYATGDITTPLYMGDFGTNFLGITYGGNTREIYLFGGNPVISDDHYMPERNALNSENGDVIAKVYFSAIRNAAASRFTVTNVDTGELLREQKPGAFYSGYYISSGEYWTNIRQNYNLGWNPKGLAEGTHVEVTVELAPEYFLQEDGTVDWDSLGKGTGMTVPIVIDNTAPVLEQVNLDLLTETLQVTASDDRYVAGVAIYDGGGQRQLAAVGAKQEIEMGESAVYEIPVSGIGGSKFYLQIMDYALNTTTYLIERELSTTVDLPQRMFFNLTDYQWYQFDPEDPENYTPWIDHDSDLVYWGATMVDNMIYVVDDYGELRIIDAVETYKDYLVGNTGKAFSDLAYNKADGCLYGVTYQFSWSTPKCGDLYRIDMYTGESEKLGAIGVYATALACDENGNFYCNSHGTGEVYTFTVDSLGAPELFTDVGDMYSTAVQGMEYDYSTGRICWITYSFNRSAASSPTCYIEIDSETGESTRIEFETRRQFSCLLVPQEGVKNGAWANPTDTVLEMTLSDTELDMLRGSFHQIKTQLRPWNLSDRTLTYKVYTTNLMELDAVAEFDPNGVSNYSSMVAAEDGSLYLSLYNGKSNDIYHLGQVGTTRTYRASWLASMGEGICPASLYAAELNNTEAESEAQQSIGRETCIEPATVTTEPAQETGTLQTVETKSGSTVTNRDDTVTLNITAKDAEGTDVSSFNGLVTVTYDAEDLILQNVNVHGEYRSVNTTESGKVIFAYADLEGFQADENVATLVFTRKDGASADGSFTVAYDHVNDQDSGYVETLNVSCGHGNTEIRNAKEATCTEDGYTGDIYCTDCGELVESGKVIPAYCPSAKFTDMNVGTWYHESVDVVVENGYMNGTSNTTFEPYSTLTRAQLITVLYRIAGTPEVEGTAGFSDVSETAYYQKAVAWAVENGIAKGHVDGTFRPYDAVTRQDLAVFFFRFAQYQKRDVSGRSDLSGYEDSTAISPYALEAVQWAVNAGILNGVSNTSLAPRDAANRASIAAVTQRYCTALAA